MQERVRESVYERGRECVRASDDGSVHTELCLCVSVSLFLNFSISQFICVCVSVVVCEYSRLYVWCVSACVRFAVSCISV